jgi:hypothetical protein
MNQTPVQDLIDALEESQARVVALLAENAALKKALVLDAKFSLAHERHKMKTFCDGIAEGSRN